MALKTINDLPDITRITDSYTFVIDDGEHNYKITWGALKALMSTVLKFEADTDDQFKGFLKLTLNNDQVFRAKPSDPDKQDKLEWDDTPTEESDNPVKSKGIKAALDEKQSLVATGTLTLSSANWEGEGPYTQELTIESVTDRSKIDLQPGTDVLTQLREDGVMALWIQNEGGMLTAYAMGAAPKAEMTVQYTRTEIVDES